MGQIPRIFFVRFPDYRREPYAKLTDKVRNFLMQSAALNEANIRTFHHKHRNFLMQSTALSDRVKK